MWNFDRLPKSEYENVVKAWEQPDYLTLYKIYTKYKIPDSNISACCAFKTIELWTKYALREYIYKDQNRNLPG